MEVLAIIPARGGSKGLPGKNLRLLGGHPLIAWSIAAARSADSVTRIICTTDDAEISRVAADYGAEVPFVRPADLASDTATDLGVFRHALDWLLEREGYRPDAVVQLRPTTPFRAVDWIDSCVDVLRSDDGLSCVRSVAVAPHTPYKMWVSEGDRLRPLLTIEGNPESFNSPRQELPVVYWHTGQIDVIRTSTIYRDSMSGSSIAPIFVSGGSAIDIDTILDFKTAELSFDSEMPLEFSRILGSEAPGAHIKI